MIRTIIILFALSATAFAQVSGSTGSSGGSGISSGGTSGGGGGGSGTSLDPPDSTLGQYEPGGASLPTGGALPGTAVQFKAVNNNSSTFGNLRLEVEARPVGEAFQDSPTVIGAGASSGTEASVTLDDICWNDGFHWQARWAAGTTSVQYSSWVEGPLTSPNPSGDADFFVTAAPPGFSSQFNSDVGWTRTNTATNGTGWHVDGTPLSFPAPGGPFQSAPASLNYNNGTTYDSGSANSGTAVSPAIDLSPLSNPTLTFWCNHEVQDGGTQFDQRWVRILDSATGGVLFVEQVSINGGQCGLFGYWHTHEIPLDGAWGLVRIEFTFDTVDDQLNGFAGWFVDDVTVASTSGGGGGSGGSGGGSQKDNPNGDTNFLETICAAGAANPRPVPWWPLLPALLLVVAALGRTVCLPHHRS